MSYDIEIVVWRPLRKNSLRGFMTIRINNMIIHGCAVLTSNDWRWIGMPSKPRLGRDGQQLTDHAGKPFWPPIVSWRSRESSDRFSHAVIEALLARHPDALDDGDDAR
ncbi:MAG: hypothetical protein ACJ8AW_32885 [Rhodopila sp.]